MKSVESTGSVLDLLTKGAIPPGRPKNARVLLPPVPPERLSRVLQQTPLFDPAYYLRTHHDVREAGVDPLHHYLAWGSREKRSPNLFFDVAYYLESFADAELETEPVSHYLTIGARSGRDPHPLFCTDYYLARNPDVRDAHLNPLEHFLSSGLQERREFHPLFDVNYYLEQCPDVTVHPVIHYLAAGAAMGIDPHPLFDTSYYVEKNADVKESRLNPLVHYIQYGGKQGLDPHPCFETKFYMNQVLGKDDGASAEAPALLLQRVLDEVFS